jgi:predicted nucleotide-binding protein
MPRPTLFVGSSTEGLRIAKAIGLLLEEVCEVSLWSQGVFGLTQGTLESLVTRLPDFDFAVLVLTADDLSISRGAAKAAARDNVLFELGLFIGSLGRDRTFIVHSQVDPPDLPTDLAGVTAATFYPPERGDLQSALGAACTRIQYAIERLGVRKISADVSFESAAEQAEGTARNEWRYDHPREYVGSGFAYCRQRTRKD